MAAAGPTLRRHRLITAAQTSRWGRGAARQRLVPRRPRLRRRERQLRQRHRLPRRAGDHLRRRSTPDVVTDDSWTAGCPTARATACTTARPSTPDSGVRTPDRPDRCARSSSTEPPCSTQVGPLIIRQEEIKPIADLDLAVRQDAASTSGRTWSAGSGLRARARPGHEIVLRHAEVLEHGELGTRPLRAAKATDTVHPVRRRGRLRAHLDLPRLPVRRGDRLARRADRRRPRSRRRALRHEPHRLVRVLRRAAQPAAQQRRSGAEGQLPRRPDRLPAARRAARLDRRHRRLRPHRRVPVRRRRLPPQLAARPRRRDRAQRRRMRALRRPRRAEVRRLRRRTSRTPSRARARSGATPRSGCRGRCGTPTATRPARRPLPRHAAAPGVGRAAPLRERPVGHRLPVRRLARPGRPAGRPGQRQGRPGRRRHRLPLPVRLPSPPRPRELLGKDEDAARWTALADRIGTAFATALRRRRRDDRVRLRHRLRAGDLLRPARRRPARSRPAIGSPSSSPRRDYRDHHRLRRHPVRHLGAVRRPATSTTPTGCCSKTAVPVLALPGHHGRDDHLGALGLDAARRHRSTRAR